MVNILSFPDFGCGGLFCTLFNEQTAQWSKKSPATLNNKEHSMLKCDANHRNNWSYDVDKFNSQYNKCQQQFNGKFCGTHIPLQRLKLPDSAGKLIQITTETLSSRMLLWLRAHHIVYLLKHPIENVVKQREFSKDFINMVVKPYHGAINIELGNYFYDKNYRQKVHHIHNLRFDQQTFDQWISVNKYIFDLRKTNMAVKVFLDNLLDSSYC